MQTGQTTETKQESVKKIKKILLTQPNYAWFGGRAWKMLPYSLGILNACIKDHYQTDLLDPSYDNLSEEEVMDYIRKTSPDAICIGTVSSEALKPLGHMTSLIKSNFPDCIIIIGGALPTTVLHIAMKDKNVDYWLIGEGEYRFLSLLNELNKDEPDLPSLDGLAYYENGVPHISHPKSFIADLDSIPFPDYGRLDFIGYGNKVLKYSLLVPRKSPYTISSTSRGCVYSCVFCGSPGMSGKKVRMRSAENVLKEIDELYAKGIKEIIYLDDLFLYSRERAMKIMEGLEQRKYDLSWKCCNLAVWQLDEELLDMMWKTGSYQITISVESGNQEVASKIIKKPVILKNVPPIVDYAKKLGFEIVANFVIGFPHETWDQILESVSFGDKLNVDLVNFHIATPLPNTELTGIAMKEGLIPEDFIENFDKLGYTGGAISTNEFTSQELKILRAFEWDRINFRSPERKKTIAKMHGITLEELEEWRKQTRRQLGVVNKA